MWRETLPDIPYRNRTGISWIIRMSDVLDPTKPWCCTIDLAIPQSSVGRSPRPFPWRLPFPIQVRYRFVAPSSSWASCRQSMPPTPTWTSALQRCRFRDPSRPGHAGHHVHWDVPGSQLWLIDHPALRRARHNCDTGHSTGRATRSILPPRRQAAGPPSAWSQPFQSTHERPRRWCDAGALGRQSVPASQKAGDEGWIRGPIPCPHHAMSRLEACSTTR